MFLEKRETDGEKETGRLEAFSDGVFAVAITLLVFNLKVPQLSSDTSIPEGLKNALFSPNQWAAYFTFFISFSTVLIMWISHHSMFKLVQKSDTLFQFANGFLLLLVTVVPFPTELVGTYLATKAASTACVVYAGLFTIINVAYNLLWWSAAYHRRLLFPNVSRALIKMRTRNYLLGLPSYLCAMVIGVWLPAVSIGICSVLWLFWAFTSYEKAPTRKPHENLQQGVEA